MITNFVNNNTVIDALWLNKVDRTISEAIGNGTSNPTTPTEVKQNLGLNNVDNVSDVNKPISIAAQTALNGKQDILPTQVGNAGKFLGTNGTTLSWNTVDALPLQTGNNGKYLTTNGSVANWTTFSGVSLTGIETLTNKTITTPVINTNINFSGTSGAIQVNGVDKVIIGSTGITSGVSGGGLVLGTPVNTTSGTSIDFTGIPSWVKRITVMFAGVSTNSGSTIQLQIGAGSIDTTSYISNGLTSNSGGTLAAFGSTTGFAVQLMQGASDTLFGHAILTLSGSNQWIFSASVGSSSAGRGANAGGYKTLSGSLDRIRLTTVVGTDTFDAGSFNILYE